MKNAIRLTSILFIALVSVSSCTFKTSEDSSLVDSTSESTNNSSSSGGGDITSVSQDDAPWADIANGYYADISDSTGTTLLGEIHDLIVDTHKTYTSYGQLRGGSSGDLIDIDYDPDDPSRLYMFYSHASITNMWDSGNTYNREHVWPKSLSSGLWDESNGGSDMHHIRPTFNPINSNRGNKLFGELTSGSESSYTYEGVKYVGGTYSNSLNLFEPMDFAKGDCARIIMYMFVHYNTPSGLGRNNLETASQIGTLSSRGSGNLPITNVIDGSKQEAFELLLSWHELDPVSEEEINRNNGAYSYQRNRNPFIDYPEFAELIWG